MNGVKSIQRWTMSRLRKRILISMIPGVMVTTLLATPLSAFAEEELSIEETVEALKLKVDSLTANDELVRGRKIYQQACSPCHGIRGDGKGPAALGFDPAPRNFRRGSYKFRTTVSGALPLDTDLQRTIREGVPGTEMPRWKNVLSEHDISAVVQYIKTFSPMFADPDSLPLPEDILEVPEVRPFERSLASIAAGRQIYIDQDCIKCHGDKGKGDGNQADELVDDWDDPIRPADLTQTHYKNGKRDQDVYRVFTSALNGTPMPAFDEISDEERWQLVDYVQSLERKKSLWWWLFIENPNQVRHPAVEKSEMTDTTRSDG